MTDSFECKDCKRIFGSAEGLRQHTEAKHGVNKSSYGHSIEAKSSKKYYVWITIGIILLLGGFWISSYFSSPGKYDEFAACIKDSGAKFYGTFWCPHCQNQKAEFGKSAKLLPYIECSTTDGKGQLPVCQQAKIDSYPTWEFSDGTRQSGEVPIETLAEKTNCILPI